MPDVLASDVDFAIQHVCTTGSIAGVKPSVNKLSIDVGVGGGNSTWNHKFLSPATGHA